MIWFFAGCMSMDPFFFDPEKTDHYELGYEVIPAEQVEEISFQTEDGETLYGVWAHQEDPTAPLLVYFHGNYRNIDEYWDRVELYWELGLETFIFDYRGYGRSSGSPSHKGVLIDGATAVDYVTAYLNTQRMEAAKDTGDTGLPEESEIRPASHLQYNYMGMSLGGFVAIHVAAGRTPRLLITESAFASGQLLIDDGSGGMDLPPGWLLEDAFNNLTAIPYVEAPVAMIHGKADDFVRVEHARQLYEAAKDPKALWIIDGANHGDIPEVAGDEYAARIGAWVRNPPSVPVEDTGSEDTGDDTGQ